MWIASEIIYHDKDDYKTKLTPSEKFYLDQILAFFASSDGIVGENLALHFIKHVQIPEVRYFYYFQGMMEAVHAKVYSNLITTFIDSQEEREELFDSINTSPIIKKKADWCLRWMNLTDEAPKDFFRHLVAFLAVEGIFFAGSFASIFWLRDRGILANSLGVANELISRDETLHADFAALLVNEYAGIDRPSDEEIKEILLSALDLEKEFVASSLPDKLLGMNKELMFQYLEFITDVWLESLNVERVFDVENPFPFMTQMGQRRKDLFFEKTKTNYARATTNQEMDWDAI